MATIFTEGGEGGSAGSAVTTSNTNFSSVQTGALISSSHPRVGTRSIRVATGTTADTQALTAGQSLLGTRTLLFAEFFFYADALPPSNTIIARVSSGGADRASLRLNAAGNFTLRNGNTNVWTSNATTGVYVPGTFCRVELRFDSTLQEMEAKISADNATAADIAGSGAKTFTTGNFDTFDIGFITSVASWTMFLDRIILDDADWVGPIPNVPPIVDAGADQTGIVPGATVTLTMTASDPDGTIASRQWTQTGGSPTVTMTGATTATATFTAPSVGGGTVLTFQAAATDNRGATTTDPMTVTVLPAGGAPVVSAGPDQMVEPWATVTLLGSASDVGGSITAQGWTQISGTTVTLSGASTTTATYESPGLVAGDTAVFRFSATDNSANTVTDDVTVTTYPVTELANVEGVLTPLRPTKVGVTGGFGRTPFGRGPFGR